MHESARRELQNLLQQRAEQPARAAEIDGLIHMRFARDCSVLILDLSGFTRLTMRHGIIHFLTVVQRMCSLASPVVACNGGVVFKQEADNLLARFDDVPAAVEAAVGVMRALKAINTRLDDDAEIHAAIGIGYGNCLVIDDEDVFGNEMNLACKLGEDLARAGEILLTQAARSRIVSSERRYKSVQFTVAGMELTAHALVP